MKIKTTHMAILASTSLLLAGPAAMGADPKTALNESWVSVSGTVTQVTPTTFELKYDSGKITVEFDDWDSESDAYKLLVGDKVVVTGKIDDDLFEKRTIEGSSVYVENISTYFHASADDEEDAFVMVTMPIEGVQTTVQGKVSAVTGEGKFEINTGTRKFTVDTGGMSYNPLDDEGYQKIDAGDRVSVTGKFDDQFFTGMVLKADSIVTLSNNG